MEKQEEFTTWDHMEMLKGEIPELDVLVMAVYGATRRGVNHEEALAKYGISLEQYEQNIDRCLS
jgi:hypothetical protein